LNKNSNSSEKVLILWVLWIVAAFQLAVGAGNALIGYKLANYYNTDSKLCQDILSGFHNDQRAQTNSTTKRSKTK
jgi:hypothetical protein